MASHAKAPLDAKRTPDGTFRDECADCGTIIVASTPDDVLGAVCACAGRRVVRHLVELVCAHCAREIGTVVLAGPRAPILVPRRLRCLVCGGQPIPGERTEQITYSPMPRVVARRGRSPRWLVEQRRLQRSA